MKIHKKMQTRNDKEWNQNNVKILDFCQYDNKTIVHDAVIIFPSF